MSPTLQSHCLSGSGNHLPDETCFTLLVGAHRTEHDATVGALLTRYKLDIIPIKAAATRRGDLQALINLRKVFGAMRPRDVLPRHIYKYVDTRVDKNGEKIRATALL
jgi:hypothetical protein